jgi:hypothetical protein
MIRQNSTNYLLRDTASLLPTPHQKNIEFSAPQQINLNPATKYLFIRVFLLQNVSIYVCTQFHKPRTSVLSAFTSKMKAKYS